MENLLKKQLAQIKARAMMIAGRADQEEMQLATSDDAPRPCAAPTPGVSNAILDAAIRSGAVVRGADARTLAPRRGPWWWRRRVAQGSVPPVVREGSGFEAEFQRLLAQWSAGEPLPIERAVPGEPRSVADSSYYLIHLAGHEVDPLAVTEARRFARLRNWPEPVSRTVVGPRRVPASALRAIAETPPAPSSVLFLDIETAGLSANTYVFLCGLMHFDGEHFHVEQVFARDYTEEEGLLRYTREAMAHFDTVVTYNGAAFDLPFIRTRMAVHRIPDVDPVGSVDLLHSSRRVFRERLPNCRLVTVERHLRGVDRVDDIPSRFIPRAYHEYVRTRDARIMRNVVYHNRMDLFTMAVILNHFADGPPPVEASFAAAPAVEAGPGSGQTQVPF